MRTRGWVNIARAAAQAALVWVALAGAAAAADSGGLTAPNGIAVPVRPPRETSADKGLPAASGWQFESNSVLAYTGGTAAPLGDVNGDGYSDFAVGSSGTNSVQVFFGGPAGPGAAPNQTITQAINSFGTRVAPAGDVNADGYHDLLVSAPYSGDGRVWVYLGSAGGLQSPPVWTYTHNDIGFANAMCGESIDTAGDVNGDGYDDIVVGISFSDDGKGAAYLFYGNAGGLSANPGWWQAGGTGWRCGESVAGAGDVNADGYADVIVGYPGLSLSIGGNQYYGSAEVFHGGPGGLAFVPATRLYGTQFGAFQGFAVSRAGDMNGDGYADVAVGSPLFDYPGATDAGRALVYPGSGGGVVASPIWEEWGWAANKQFGTTVAPAGDVNGDGMADLAVGVPDRVSGVANNGSTYLVQGGPSIYISWWIDRFDGAGFGATAVTAGDVNHDGFGDLLVGSPLWTNGQSGEGRVEIFFGAANAPLPYAGQTVAGRQEDATFTFVTTAVGDVNGDGYTDAVVTAPDGDTFWYDEGFADFYYGTPWGLSYGLTWNGEYDGGQFGYAAAGAGDVNGDGYADVIIGAPNAGAGLAYVWYGGPAGPSSGAANWVVSLGTSAGRFGHSVATAGDVNGDGYADVIVGAPYDDAGQTDEGRAHVFLGSASGLATSPAWTTESNQDGARRGCSVAGVGDVNRDGYGDVAVGEESFDRFLPGGFSQPDVGRALVFLGGSGSPAAAPVWSARGDWGHQFGHVVAAAGDVNGDGFSDVLVTAIGAGATASGEGGAYVFLGGASGPAAFAHWSYVGTQANAFVGWSAAGGGDVNGDGLSDVIIGAPNFDGPSRPDCGQALLFAGPLTGTSATTPLWSFTDNTGGYQYAGRSVSAAGDFNGDGFADILTGSPGFSQDFIFQGRLFVFWSNGLYNARDTQIRAAQQRRGNDAAPVALLGRTGSPPALRLKALGGSAAGRTKVRLEWEIEPLATLTDGFGLGRSSWIDNGPSPAVFPPTLDSGSLGLPASPTAHWRARVASRSPYFPGTPWLSPPGNGRQEGDLRARDGLLTAVDGPARPLSSLPVSVAPNPFNPRTTIAFENAREGRVRVELYDARGRSLGVVLDESRPAGRVELPWDGRDANGRPVASGAYYARVAADGQEGVARLLLVR